MTHRKTEGLFVLAWLYAEYVTSRFGLDRHWSKFALEIGADLFRAARRMWLRWIACGASWNRGEAITESTDAPRGLQRISPTQAFSEICVNSKWLLHSRGKSHQIFFDANRKRGNSLNYTVVYSYFETYLLQEEHNVKMFTQWNDNSQNILLVFSSQSRRNTAWHGE